MKNMSLLQKILGVVACCLIVAVIAVGAHGIHAFVKGTAPVAIDEGDYEFVFKGNIALLDQEYDVAMMGSEGRFLMDAGSIRNVMDGTYTFTEGQGWTFKFNDAMGTIVRSQYDTETKASSFIYALDMGARGAGNLRLSCEDKDFKPAEKRWNDIPAFSGTAAWLGGSVSTTAVTACDDAGNFRIFTTGGSIFTVIEITGKYELVGDEYIFTSNEGATYVAVKDPATGLFTFTCNVINPTVAAAMHNSGEATVVFTQDILTVDE